MRGGGLAEEHAHGGSREDRYDGDQDSPQRDPPLSNLIRGSLGRGLHSLRGEMIRRGEIRGLRGSYRTIQSLFFIKIHKLRKEITEVSIDIGG
jgi:hypothetical protein